VSNYVDLDALWRVAALSAIFAIGVVALYALGLRALATGADGAAAGPARRTAGYACFALCLGAVLVGIWVMLDK
jgi:cytochrome bd-type quinol oxidase subunit 2